MRKLETKVWRFVFFGWRGGELCAYTHPLCRAYANDFHTMIGTSTHYLVLNTLERDDEDRPVIVDEIDRHDESEHCHSFIIYNPNMDITFYLFSRTCEQKSETNERWFERHATDEEAEKEAEN